MVIGYQNPERSAPEGREASMSRAWDKQMDNLAGYFGQRGYPMDRFQETKAMLEASKSKIMSTVTMPRMASEVALVMQERVDQYLSSKGGSEDLMAAK